MPSFLVYKLTNLITGRGYIGVTTCSLEKRWREHVSTAKTRAPWAVSRAIRKHGKETFTMALLYEAASAEEMFVVERGLIAAHGTLVPLGYNVAHGGGSMNHINPRLGEDNINSVLTEEVVRFIRRPDFAHIVNREIRDLVEERFGIIASRDAIRDARRGDGWRHLNAECPPVKAQQGGRNSEKKIAACRRTVNLPHVRAASVAVSTERLKRQKIAAKLTVEQAMAIYVDPRPKRVIEREYGLSHGTVGQIKQRKTWADVTKDLPDA